MYSLYYVKYKGLSLRTGNTVPTDLNYVNSFQHLLYTTTECWMEKMVKE